MILPDAALAQHVVIVGGTGAGKSYTAKGVVEGLLDAGRRVCVIDPTGAWHGLRSSADGRSPAYSVLVLGGEHGDLPLSAGAGVRVAELIATRNLPVVLDLSELLIGDRHRLMTDFAEAIYRLNRQPLHLVLDEADEIAPQNPMPETRRLLHHWDRIVRRGRIRGFRVTMITQRPAVLHKNVMTQAQTLIAMRLPAPQDRKAVEAWVKGNADEGQAATVLGSLARLQRGEGWVWCPSLGILERTTFPAIRTFDSGRSPEDGEMVTEPVALAKVDLAEIRSALAPTDEAPPAKRGAPEPSTADLEAMRGAASAEGYAAGRADEARHWHGVVDQIRARLREIDEASDAIRQAIGGGHHARAVAAPEPAPPPRPPRPAAVGRGASPRASGGMHAAARAILSVLVARHPARFSWSQAATLAGLKARGGHFNAGRQELRAGGYLVEEGETIIASAAGLTALGADVRPTPATPAELLDLWCSRLSSPAPEMLRWLAGQERPTSREDLAVALGKAPRGGHWNGGLAVLRTNELIVETREGIVASDLFRTAPR